MADRETARREKGQQLSAPHKAKYAVHPGYIFSTHDGQRHYIGAARLAELYNLPAGSWIRVDLADVSTTRGFRWSDYVHLYPVTDGNYAAALASALRKAEQR